MGDQIVSLTKFKSSATQMLHDIQVSGATLVLTQNGSATAVVQDVETYRKHQRALLMLKLIAQGEADIENDLLYDQEDVFSELEAEIQ
ncbi:MAG: type II toxin-antitoxin system Phd/YefM family antitoxin [Gammaproteobacteria bacterium]|nr:type II toxin-antitoxin system Phd/YefM family antitoxin [Gammaproteobacteria bacterium]MBU1654995.1 type II toxin-antitoxin system Phd/YefM family antitoxin [Gammaproteobacteria bacterium]MBU1960016.1 type II toxin-antitoxin system Phd/YefM family antitoxin [Gammaproteobacteria bacterium]